MSTDDSRLGFRPLTSTDVRSAPPWAGGHELLPDRWRDASTRAAGAWIDGRLVAVGRLYPSRVHAGRYWTEVIVAPECRRRGHGRAMVLHLASLRSDRRPLCTRGYASSETVSFAHHLGARRYQTCPPERVPTAAAHRLITDRAATPSGAEVAWSELEQAWVDVYAWVHAGWSPVSPGFEIPLLQGFRDDLDRRHTRVVATPTIRAAAFVFLDDPLPVIVAECRTPQEPDGLDLLRACVRDSLASLAEAGIEAVTFDGHDSDPHFRPLLDELPATGERFELLEWTPDLHGASEGSRPTS